MGSAYTRQFPARTEPAYLSVEARLLLRTARLTSAGEGEAALLDMVGDWQRLLDLSVSEGAQPVFSQRLRELGACASLGRVDAALQRLERAAVIRQSYLQKRLVDVTGELSRAGIRVMLLKGAALAHGVYRSFLSRAMSDLDLLLQDPAQALEARQVLIRAGWTSRFRGDLDDLYAPMHHLPPLLDSRMPGLQVGLELHTDIIPPALNPFDFSGRHLWCDARRAEGLPEGTYVPSRPHALLHCCVHFAWSHMLQQSAWRAFRDVAALCEGNEIDWKEFVRLARQSRAATCCYWTLRLARSFAGAAVPDTALASLSPGWPEAMLGLLERHVAQGMILSERICPSIKLGRAMWAAAIRPRRSGHGARRPWHTNELEWEMLEDSARAEADTPEQGRDLRVWLQYTRLLTGLGAQRTLNRGQQLART